ncbi:MAG TPA: sigma-70 family RNA polymerase sigma factor, partial [Aquabacterium sp.]|nr:sigma-70 family RNA polymerase sigma factor [Aquabacterium sp.]
HMTLSLDLAEWAREWRGPMLRFAQLHLQPREDAEDAVQDALASLLGVDSATLAGVDPRRYLFGILKHKITDRLRLKYRPEVGYSEAFSDDLDQILFDDRGHWVESVAPQAWSRPDAQLQTEQFFQVVDVCVNKLPVKPARVFSMKEFLECEPEEICVTLGLTKTDYWQCLSRARKQIQMCLNQSWFEGEAR